MDRLRLYAFNSLLFLTIIIFILLMLNFFAGAGSFNAGFIKISFRNPSGLFVRFLFLSALTFIVYPAGLKKYYKYFNYFALFLIFALFIRWSVFNPYNELKVRSDGVGYYSYLRSAVMDRDLDFENEYAQLWSGKYKDIYPTDRTDTGYMPNYFAIGPSLFWSPFFLSAHGVSHILNALGAELKTDGYSDIYLAFCSAGTIIYGVAGILIVYSFLKLFFSASVSFMAVLFVLLGTSLTYYSFFELFMSHIHSFFMISLLLYYLFKYFQVYSRKHWLIAGILLGISALVRWQNISYIILIFMYAGIEAFREKNEYRSIEFKKLAGNMLLFFASLFFAILPQLIVFRIIFGFWFGVPQGKGFLLFDLKRVFYVLFSSHNGLFHWHPVIFIAFAGLILASFRSIKSLSLLFVFLLQVYISSMPADWWAGDSFGMRRMVNTGIIIAFGLGYLLDFLSKKKIREVRIYYWTLIIIFMGLCIINIFMAFSYAGSLIPHGVPFSYTESLRAVHDLTYTGTMTYPPDVFLTSFWLMVWIALFEFRLKKYYLVKA